MTSSHALLSLEASTSRLGNIPYRCQSVPQLPPYQLLLNAARQIAANSPSQAQITLAKLLATLGDHPQAVQYQLFTRGLAHRLDEKASQQANLYLADLPVTQIELFNLLARHVPFVSLSAEIANRCLADFCQNRPEVSLIDIGMGTGRQLVALLEQLHHQQRLPHHITIIGIEPAQDSLAIADTTLQATAQALGIPLDFHPICRTAEDLSEQDWWAIRALANQPVINASFALHHIRDREGIDMRDYVLQKILTVAPRALVMAEPNADHVEPDLVQRLQNCWQHFGAAFRVIDQLPIEQRDKDALKVNFFGREIDDILGNREALRTERHEPVARWLQRLHKCGYKTSHPIQIATEAMPPVQVQRHDGYIGLDYAGETIISLICATPDIG